MLLWFLFILPENISDYLLSYSYDDHLRVYVQNPGEIKPNLILKSIVNLGGAVWRTIWVPENIFIKDTLAGTETENNLIIGTACARNGIHFVRINTHNWETDVVLSCTDHLGPLAYGFDIRINNEEQSLTVASCYFDSHLLHIWDVKKEQLGLL